MSLSSFSPFLKSQISLKFVSETSQSFFPVGNESNFIYIHVYSSNSTVFADEYEKAINVSLSDFFNKTATISL